MSKVYIYKQGNIINTKAGKLTVVLDYRPIDSRQRRLKLKCFCGAYFNTLKMNVNTGRTSSCGCYSKKFNPPSQRTHGHSWRDGKASPTYGSYQCMKNRCKNKAYSSYNRYGGRGIKVCDRWEESFLNFLEDMGERPKGKTLDRINNDGNYEPDNCRWATPKEQSRNMHNVRFIEYGGKRQTLKEWANELGIKYGTISTRHTRGLPVERILHKGRLHPSLHSAK